MSRFRRFTALVVVVWFLSALAAPARAGGLKCKDPLYRDSYSCREVVVQYRDDFDLEATARRLGVRPVGAIAPLRLAWLEVPLGTDPKLVVAGLKKGSDGRPERGVVDADRSQFFVSPECRQLNVSILELGTDGSDRFHLQRALAALRNPVGPGSRGVGVTVAVLDTGVSRSHPELAGALESPGIDLIDGSELADDTGDGRDEDDPPDGVADEGVGHGTAVAGLIHAVAPDARILPVRVLDDECQGSAYAFAAGVVAAVDRGAQIVNLSLGAYEESLAVERAVHYAARHGVLVIAPTGNIEPSERLSERIQFPADQFEDVLGVAAVDSDLVAPWWSVADGKVALAAPGVGVIAPYRGGYALLDGSSFSAALVSGAAAVALGTEPGLDARRLKRRLRETAIPVDPWNIKLHGRLGAGVPDLTALGLVK